MHYKPACTHPTCWTSRSSPSYEGSPLAGKLKLQAAEQARSDYFAFTIARYELSGLAERVWALRQNYTTYDACYVALAEALDTPRYTCDRKLASAGHSAEVLVFPRTHLT